MGRRHILINYYNVGSKDGLKHIVKGEPTSPFADRDLSFLFFSVITFPGNIILSAHWL